jgi:uncharacterized membrane protein
VRVVAVSLFWLTFRILHVLAGVLWVGSTFMFVGIIGPSAAEVGPSAGPLLAVAVRKRKVTKLVTAFATITVLAGWGMWIAHAVDAGLGNWIGSSFGLGLTIGGVLATIAWYVGVTGVGQNVDRLVDLGEELATAEGPPPPERVAEMGRIQASLKSHGQIDLSLQILAVLAMATARYW